MTASHPHPEPPLWPPDFLKSLGHDDPFPDAPPPVVWAVDDFSDGDLAGAPPAGVYGWKKEAPGPFLKPARLDLTVHASRTGDGLPFQLVVRQALVEAVRRPPASSTAFCDLGERLLEDGYVRAAEQALARAVQLDGRNIRALVAHGRALTLCGWFDRALVDFEQALQAAPAADDAPQKADVFLALGDGWLDWGEVVQASSCYVQARRCRPDDAAIFLRQARACCIGAPSPADLSMDRASYWMDCAVEAKGGNDPAVRLGWIQTRLATGRHEEALAACDALVAAEPRYLPALLLRSQVRLARKDFDGAVQDSARAVQLNPAAGPQAADPWIDRAQAALEGHHHEAVKRFLVAATEIAPAYDAVWTAAARAGMPFSEEVLARFQPGTAADYLAKGDLLRAVHQARSLADEPAPGAAEAYSAAIRLAPNCALAYYHRAGERFAKDDLDGAAEDLAVALRLQPKLWMAHERRGQVRRAQGDDEAAAADRADARRIDAENVQHYGLPKGWRRRPRHPAELSEAWPPQKPGLDQTAGCGRRRLGAKSLPSRVRVARSDRTEEHFEAAAALHSRDDFDGAVQSYTKAVDLRPDDVAALTGRGQAKLDRPDADVEGALADFDEALRLDPNFGRAYFHRGRAHLAQGDFAAMFATCSVLVKHADDPPPAVDRGRARGESDAAAIEDFTKAMRCGAAGAEVYLHRGLARRAAGDVEGALADFEEAVRRDPGCDAARFNLGLLKAEIGFLTSALADFDRALPQHPRPMEAHFHRGAARFAYGDLEGAAADFARIKDGPLAAEAGRRRAAVLVQRGETTAALKLFREARELARGRPEVEADLMFDHGLLQLRRSRLDGARADFDGVLKRAPGRAAAYEGRGRCRYRRSDLEGALVDLDEALRLDPRAATAFHLRGLVRWDRGEPELALRDFNDALRLDPQSTDSYYERALLWISKKEHYAAIRDFGAAIRLDPTRTEAYLRRGDAWSEVESWATAESDYGEAIRLGLRQADLYAARGRARQRLGDAAGAASDFSAATRRVPNDKKVFLAVLALLRTCADPAAAKAVEFVRKAIEQRRWKDAATLEAMALTLQAGGAFELAISMLYSVAELHPPESEQRRAAEARCEDCLNEWTLRNASSEKG